MIDVARLTNGAWVVADEEVARTLIKHESTGFAWWVEARLLDDEQVWDDLFDSLDNRLLHMMVQRGMQRSGALSGSGQPVRPIT